MIKNTLKYKFHYLNILLVLAGFFVSVAYANVDVNTYRYSQNFQKVIILKQHTDKHGTLLPVKFVKVKTHFTLKPQTTEYISSFHQFDNKQQKGGNGIFEFFARFNDNLQQLIRFFDFSEQPKKQTKHTENKKNKNENK